MNALLTAHLLYALSNGSSNLDSPLPLPSPAEILSFQKTPAAEAVNILWFAALGLSLGAVMVAMLAKQWIGAYSTNIKTDGFGFACHHQRKLNGLHRWRLPLIMTLLPVLLHAALFLFLVGLIIYMWQLDFKVSVATCVILGTLFMFYFSSGCFAILDPSCPFVTPMSQFISQITPTRGTSQNKEADLLVPQAVMWLASSHNPEVASTSLQSLAGLRRGFPGYDKEKVTYLASDALEHLCNCFVPEWRRNGTYCLRRELRYEALCYARALMNLVDDSRGPANAFEPIMKDSALPVFLELLGKLPNPSMAMLALCVNQRFLHRKELVKWGSVRDSCGLHDPKQAARFLVPEPSKQNMDRILNLLARYIKGEIFLQPYSVEIAMETIGFAPLPWVFLIAKRNADLEPTLLPLLQLQRASRDNDTGIRVAMARTLAILSKSHKLRDQTKHFGHLLRDTLAIVQEVEAICSTDYDGIRELMLQGLAYFTMEYKDDGETLTTDAIFSELIHECDRRTGEEVSSFCDREAVETIIPLLPDPRVDKRQKASILKRLNAYAVAAIPGFNLHDDSLLYHITPRNPFPPDTVLLLVETLEEHHGAPVPLPQDLTALLHIIVKDDTHRKALIPCLNRFIELSRTTESAQIAHDIFWILTESASQSIPSQPELLGQFFSSGLLQFIIIHCERYGITPTDVYVWANILNTQPSRANAHNLLDALDTITSKLKRQDKAEIKSITDRRAALLRSSSISVDDCTAERALAAAKMARDNILKVFDRSSRFKLGHVTINLPS